MFCIWPSLTISLARIRRRLRSLRPRRRPLPRRLDWPRKRRLDAWPQKRKRGDWRKRRRPNGWRPRHSKRYGAIASDFLSQSLIPMTLSVGVPSLACLPSFSYMYSIGHVIRMHLVFGFVVVSTPLFTPTQAMFPAPMGGFGRRSSLPDLGGADDIDPELDGGSKPLTPWDSGATTDSADTGVASPKPRKKKETAFRLSPARLSRACSTCSPDLWAEKPPSPKPYHAASTRMGHRNCDGRHGTPVAAGDGMEGLGA